MSRTNSIRCGTARKRATARRMASTPMPVQSAQAVAASTFSTLWTPRSWTSASGTMRSTWPLSLATSQPSCTKTPWASGRWRLNHRTWPRVRAASPRAASSSALSTAQSCSVWFMKMRALASRYRANVRCRSRWSGVTFSTAATRGWKASIVSSWNEETSATTRPPAGKSSACAASGVPMLPPTKTGRGCSASSAPVSAVVVVLPLVPVMAIVSASIARHASSSSPITGTRRARAGASCSPSSGTPGLTTTSSTPSKAAEPSTSRTPTAASAATSGPSEATGLASVPRTSAPAATSRRAAAIPLLARPTTVARRPASVARYPRPLVATSTSSARSVIRLSFALPQLQRRERQQRQRERHDPEAHHDLGLGPAGQFVVVVQRRHAEDAAPRELERGHLHDDRHRLHHVDAADERQQQLGLGEHGQHPDGGAQGQRARVAHEDLGRMAVEPQEPDGGADQRAAEHRQLARAAHVEDLQIVGRPEVARQVCDDAEGRARHDDGADGQPVEAVGEVHGVGRPDDHEHREEEPHRAQVQEPALEEGDGQHGLPDVGRLPVDDLEQRQRQDHLRGQLAARRNPAPGADLGPVVP